MRLRSSTRVANVVDKYAALIAVYSAKVTIPAGRDRAENAHFPARDSAARGRERRVRR